jgi:hypothetical protein
MANAQAGHGTLRIRSALIKSADVRPGPGRARLGERTAPGKRPTYKVPCTICPAQLRCPYAHACASLTTWARLQPWENDITISRLQPGAFPTSSAWSLRRSCLFRLGPELRHLIDDTDADDELGQPKEQIEPAGTCDDNEQSQFTLSKAGRTPNPM